MLPLLAAATALAEPPVPGGDRAAREGDEGGPLAIPGGPGAPRPPRPGRPERAPRLDEAYVRALDTYRRERLRLRPYDSFSVSSSGGWVGWGGGWGWGGWGVGMGFPTVWVDRHTNLAIYQGEHRLDVPDAMRVMREPERAAGLDRRIRNQRRASAVATGLGVAGLAGSLAGLVGSTWAYDPFVRDLWSLETLGATGVMVGGFVVAGFPGHRADRLQYDPTATFEEGELESDVERYNAELAAELGISPVDVSRMGD